MPRTICCCFAIVFLCTVIVIAEEAPPALNCDQYGGVALRTPAGELLLDAAPMLVLFDKSGTVERRMEVTRVQQPSNEHLTLNCTAELPGGGIRIVRRINAVCRAEETELVEEFSLTPDKRIDADLEVRWPFRLRLQKGQKGISPISTEEKPAATFPAYDGRARSYPLGNEILRGQWRMCNEITDGDEIKGTGPISRNGPEGAVQKLDLSPFSHPLGLPVVQFGVQNQWLAAVCADPEFGSLLELSAEGNEIRGTIRYRYASSIVPLAAGETESRRFGIRTMKTKEAKKGTGSISRNGPEGAAQKLDLSPFSRSIDAFFEMMLPDVPPGPEWLHEIAMVDYDFLSDDGKGWARDVRELARLLKPEERRRVALCLHGWYEDIGGYGYDETKKEIKPQWMAMDRTRKIPMSREEVRRRLDLARELGFRTLLYFGTGVTQDSGRPSYRPQWNLEGEHGKIPSPWVGPDTWGKLYVRNPAHPQVFQWYCDYLSALLKAFGPSLDGFVWDETFYVPMGVICRAPQPAYCDRAMFRLVKKLTAEVNAYDPQKVFLASDSPTAERIIPGYAMVADGTYQDSGCWMSHWPFGLFPNWRNTLWSCNWSSISRFEKTKSSVERYRVPVAISNGWNDDRGPSEWSDAERDKILALFRWRLAQGPRVRYLPDDRTTDKE